MPIIEPQNQSIKKLKGLHLWHGDLSSCSQRVRITLAEKKLDWHSHIISIPKNEHATPEYQDIHPQGLVPAFVDNGTLLIESCDIIDYIDKKYPKPPFRSKNMQEHNEINEWLNSADKAQSDLKLLSHEFLFRPRKKMTPKEMNIFTNRHNNQALVEFIREWQKTEIFPKKKLDQAVNRTHANFMDLNKVLHNKKWIASDSISLADIAWIPNIHRMSLMGWPLNKYPNLTRWFSQVKLRSSYQSALVDWENIKQIKNMQAYVKNRKSVSGIHVTCFGALTEQSN